MSSDWVPSKLSAQSSLCALAIVVFAVLAISGVLFGPGSGGREFLRGWARGDCALFFTSPAFLFLFLPVTLLIFYFLDRTVGQQALVPLLIFASLVFYSSWRLTFVWILIASVIFNFSMRQILRSEHPRWTGHKRQVLGSTIIVNLLSLAFFKYTNFFIETIEGIIDVQLKHPTILLPLGISFFTFQEITLAVDTYRGAYRGGLAKYVLFVVFFPHLVAGPLVHHREMMPQFSRLRLHHYNIMVGLGLIAIGLFKKTVIADSLSPWVRTVFDGDPTISVSLLEAWSGAAAYAFQIYFDFSGYSDMALGLARLLGVRLPINFNSPYKATSIVDFWHRWHITLSRFLREYLYFPLGGNRRGSVRRYLNLMIVMLLGGLWHGANWTFVVWGALHGLMLALNHAWRAFCGTWPRASRFIPSGFARALTFASVVIAWVPFRAPNLSRTWDMWKGMAGVNGVGNFLATLELPDIISAMDRLDLLNGSAILLPVLLLLYGVCIFLPNSMQIMGIRQLAVSGGLELPPPHFNALAWRPNLLWALILGFIGGTGLLAGRSSVSEFLYWKF